ncbi:MAG TPA: NAD(P)/FAD-dependent oxidoreductase [bacterium]|nr:NAD(P)/FAD-dependent oxidoreductase [bacterium]HPT29995.1 NAD(P)/FAD-dependent oxidoreductase [bacterium]
MLYDLAILGGGPSGLLAAIAAAQRGAKVILLEKNERLGTKLLLSGGGRCNLTNIFLSAANINHVFGPQGKFLLSALSRFSPTETISFFAGLGIISKVEAEGRVFPVSNQVQEVLTALLKALKVYGADIRLGAEVIAIKEKETFIQTFKLRSGEEIQARHYIIASGGRSYPLTGSDGGAYAFLKKLGHEIVLPRPALAPLLMTESWLKRLEGLSAVVELSVKEKKIKQTGSIIFTAQGLSGPLALNLSRQMASGDILILDFFPDISSSDLAQSLNDSLSSQGAKMIKNILGEMVQPKLLPVILDLAHVSPEKKGAVVSREERQSILKYLKSFPLSVSQVAGFDQAMVTAGGVDLRQVDPKTMKSKIIKNLSLAGEVLNLDGITGGYNLQLCWSTGYVAGSSFLD